MVEDYNKLPAKEKTAVWTTSSADYFENHFLALRKFQPHLDIMISVQTEKSIFITEKKDKLGFSMTFEEDLESLRMVLRQVSPSPFLTMTSPLSRKYFTPWVCDQESCQHPVLLDTNPGKIAAAILNLYERFFEF